MGRDAHCPRVQLQPPARARPRTEASSACCAATSACRSCSLRCRLALCACSGVGRGWAGVQRRAAAAQA